MVAKAVIFSDTHFSKEVDAPRLAYLKRVIGDADFVVINGDLWDSDLCTFDEFVKSGWGELFPLLKSRNAVYIFGNHDPAKLSDSRVNLFSLRQADSLTIKAGRREIHVEHGHNVVASHNPLLDYIARWKIYTLPVGYWILRFIAPIALKILGRWAVRFRDWDGTHKIKEAVKKSSPAQIFVFGHTHAAALDLEAGYANSGFIEFGWAQYIQIEGSRIKLVDEKYQ